MKKISANTLNKFISMIFIVFFMSVSVTTVFTISEYTESQLAFQELLESTDEYNYNHELEATIDDAELSNVEDMFDNGVDAFLYAYYNYINAESYYVVTKGWMDCSIPSLGIKIKTSSCNTMIKYLDGSAIYELISYESPETDYGRTSAKFIYYNKAEGNVYMTTTTSVKEEANGDLIPTYSEGWRYSSEQLFREIVGIMPGETIYEFATCTEDPFVFNNKMVSEEKFIACKNNSGETDSYIIETSAVPAKAGGPYKKVIEFIGNTVGDPVINEMTEFSTVDKEGNLIGLTLKDKFDIVIRKGILLDVQCATNSNYNFLSIGGEIDYPLPDVSNAVYSEDL